MLLRSNVVVFLSGTTIREEGLAEGGDHSRVCIVGVSFSVKEQEVVFEVMPFSLCK